MSTLKNTTSLPSVVSPNGGLMLDDAMLNLIELGRIEADDKDTAEQSRNALVKALMDDGFTYANTVAYKEKDIKEGKVSNEVKVRRDKLMFLSLASISAVIGGEKVRLSDESLLKAMDDAVAGRAMLQGMPKGTISNERTWRGDASSHLNRIRAALQAAEGGAGKGADTVKKTDLDRFIDALQKAVTLVEKDVEKTDGSIAFDRAAKLAAWLRDGAASYGIKLPAKAKGK